MDRIRFVTRGDQRILLLDFTSCTAQEVSAIADQAPAQAVGYQCSAPTVLLPAFYKQPPKTARGRCSARCFRTSHHHVTQVADNWSLRA